MSDGEPQPGPRRFHRPGLIISLVTLVSVIILLGLGVWQLQRLAWKTDLIAARQAEMALPAAALPTDLNHPQALENRKVRLSGQFLHDQELYLDGRTRKGRVGLHVATPMRLADGRLLLVDRGWVAKNQRDPATRAAGQGADSVTLEAVLRQGGWRGSDWFQPANQPEINVWLWPDLPAMAEAANLPDLETGLYAQALGERPQSAGPIPAEAKVELRNDHLGYALTWFSLAGVLVIIFLLYHFRRSD